MGRETDNSIPFSSKLAGFGTAEALSQGSDKNITKEFREKPVFQRALAGVG
jgi:hypothetical protein